MAQLIDPSSATFTASPFADAVLTPSHAVSSTGPTGDRAAPREGTDLNLVGRPRPVVAIGRRMPLLRGRASELDDMSDGIRRSESFEVFAGEGFGKTSLVNMLLHDKPELKGSFADGVVLLSGRSVAPGDLVGALFRAFFSAEQAIALDDGEMLRRLSPVNALIVLDGVDIADEELQEIIALLTTPVFIVTSPRRRLHDFTSRAIGPLQDEDLVEAAALRLEFELNETDRQLVVQLAHLVDDSPRSWARALELVENREDLVAMVARLDGAREPRAETARLALDQASPAALNVVTLISELKGTGVSEELLEEVLGIDDSSALTVEIESQGLGLMQDGLLTVSDDIADLASEHMDGERVMGAAFGRLLAWSQTAEPEQLVEEVASLTAFADWALEHDRAEDVVELGRIVDGPLFRKGRWGAAAALLLLVRRAGEICGQPADAAWAMHQMGVRELALGDKAAAKPLLREARSIRHRLGDKAGEALTHEHLKLLGPMAALAAPFVAKFVIGFFLAAGAVTGGIIVATQDDGPPREEEVDLTDGELIPTPELTVELEGETSVRVALSLGASLAPGQIVQVIRISPDGTEDTIIEATNRTSTIDRGLAEESVYGYKARVIGEEEHDRSSWSKVKSIATRRRPTVDDDPEPPTGLAGVYEDPVVALTWTASSSNDTVGYDVLRDGTPIEQGLSGTSFIDEAPLANAVHRYHVVAYDEGDNVSDLSEPTDVIIPPGPDPLPPAPTNLRWDFDEAVGVTLGWDGTAKSYGVRRSGLTLDRLVSRPFLIDSHVALEQSVTYSVWSINATGRSDATSITFIVHKPVKKKPPAPGVPNTAVSGNVVRLTWPALTFAEYPFPVRYDVLRDGQPLAGGLGEPTYDDGPLEPGTYSYTIVAVTTDNVDPLRSDPSDAVEVSIGTPPATVSVVVVGGGTVSGDISCTDTCEDTFAIDTEISLTATESSGSTFAGWEGGGCSGTGDTCTFTVDADTDVTAAFSAGPGKNNLTVEITGDGGSVSSSPTGILGCRAATCSEEFDEASTVVLTATVDGSNTDFGGWSGSCGTSTTCTLLMDSDQIVTASFIDVPPPPQPELTVVVAGSPGTVTSSPSGIAACGATCIWPFQQDQSVVLTATPSAGSTFANWSGGNCVPTANPNSCVLSLVNDATVTATFEPTPQIDRTLTVTVTGDGSVTSTPAGIDNCSNSCEREFSNGTPVMLVATEGSGWDFVGWSGGNCPSSGDCTITMTSNTNVLAVFEEAAAFTETLVVANAGDTFIQMRFTSSLDAPWEATIDEVGGPYSDSASGTATGLVAEIVRFEGLQAGTDYTIAVTLDGEVSDEEAVQTNGGTTPTVQVAISNVVVQAFTDQIHITYETNVVANGSYKVFESGVLVQANTGQGTSAQTSHQAKPGVFCCAVNPYPLLLTPGTTYTIEITAEAGGAGQGGGNTATTTRVVATLP